MSKRPSRPTVRPNVGSVVWRFVGRGVAVAVERRREAAKVERMNMVVGGCEVIVEDECSAVVLSEVLILWI